MNLIPLAEAGLLPDAAVRFGIQRMLAKRSRHEASEGESVSSLADRLREMPLAVQTDAANRQHYEAPTEFFERVLGPRLKYSCCLFEQERTSLAEAEEAMLRLTCEHAGLASGQRVLELGCGWGSLTLWMAEQFPDSEITAVSNSHSQRRFIEARVQELGLNNLTVITADMVHFDAAGRYDRVVSVEMFEHMRNYELLFQRVAGWLERDGAALVHVFCHAGRPYLFETEGADNWMGRHFFTGGTMPSADLFDCFDDDLAISRRWRVGGLHYWRTCEAWLKNLDHSHDELTALFRRDLSRRDAGVALQRWRMFFLACAELFRYEGGDRWFVEHYLFEPARNGSTAPTTGPPATLPA
ncbi:Cyclopropane-fatty-acyl-phospholipid synthase [Pseudobythopirellula maris]|uniref:Cyclopropane-fatty-acyl-phospholipid synthase n=1 Tax=Pseudobythopirellula maris TaxID=2527991 RepID=A0A5C5ZKJ9_9BACT|nr:cyclopropane-fatty-acyl-phospholipid synthase family protein [Pseudobythopirellula maris]TWT87675.1 Cyclopropane-fatty-acyl-phospholipid synthase [Pseudobythopirellula maris]